MGLIHQIVLSHIPPRHRVNLRGWLTFNAPCCEHRGHSPDKRKRGNLMLSSDGTIAYNCYNCGFKTKFDGVDLSRHFESLLFWMKVPSEDIKRVKLELLSNKLDGTDATRSDDNPNFFGSFKEIELPAHSFKLEDVTEWDDIPESYLDVISYLDTRGPAVADNYGYYWCSSHKNDMERRLIIPFYHNGKVVGWTARYAGNPPKGVPRYFNSELQPGYLFNNAALEKPGRKYALLLEGPFDAISVDGVSALGSELSQEQLMWLKRTDKEIIVVPDRQRKNQGLIDAALVHGWSVSFPEWEDDIKDAADASARYGRLYTVRSIINNKTNSELQINVKRQMFRGS